MKKKKLIEQRISVAEPHEVYSAVKLASEIREAVAKPGNLCIDLHGAERIHTAVLQVLVAAHRSDPAFRRSLTVCGAAPGVQTVLQMAELPISDAM